MKVGDLVKAKGHQLAGQVGIIIKPCDAWDDDEQVWEVLFGSHIELMFDSGLEVINESR